MLLQEKVIIRVNPNNYKKLKKYNFCNIGEFIEINITDLSNNSHLLVDCLCDICGKEKKIQYKSYLSNISKYNYYACSPKCAISKNEKTNMVNIGTLYPSQNKKVKEKYKNTMLERYGVDNSLKMEGVHQLAIERSKMPESIEKRKKTNEINWGSDNITKTEFFFNKTKIGNDENFIKYLRDNTCLFICEDGHYFEISTTNYHNRKNDNIKLCTICNPIGDSKSIKEKELFEYIQSIYSGEIIQSYRDVLEIDIYLPNLGIGFEFNGLYWHSEEHKEKNYHLHKTNYFNEKGIRIIHIWEDEWIFKNNIIKSQIKNWLGLIDKKIWARNCKVTEIKDIKLSKNFLDHNHRQGSDISIIKLGLFYNNELVSLMTFNKSEGRKKMKENEWNLSRFCNKLNYLVVGSSTKLLKYFEKNFKVDRIVSYSDKDWSIGQLYYILGFNRIYETNPDYKYIIGNKRIHKSRYRKSKINTKLSESKQMRLNGINRIYDCGKIKFEKNYKK